MPPASSDDRRTLQLPSTSKTVSKRVSFEDIQEELSEMGPSTPRRIGRSRNSVETTLVEADGDREWTSKGIEDTPTNDPSPKRPGVFSNDTKKEECSVQSDDEGKAKAELGKAHIWAS